jgi:S-adenosylmethionine-diacylgycerolhomoserine-N-methlytransferase
MRLWRSALRGIVVQRYQEALKGYYRLHAPIYDATRWAFLFGRSRLVHTLRTRVAPKPQHILEVGCGTGKNLLQLARSFPQAQIVGCDLSEAMIQRAEARLNSALPEAHRKQLSLQVIDVTQIKPLQFDLIVCSYMLSMTDTALPNIVAHLRRCLAHGGSLAVVDFEQTRWPWFARWMRRNHVRMDGALAHALQQFPQVDVRESHAAFGVWRWLLWVGR